MTIIKRQIIKKQHLNSEVVIDMRNVGKKYIVHHEKPTLVEDVGRRLKFQKYQEFWALKDVNLQIHKGEKIGIYGCNGCGKTTLFKLITRITKPTVGSIITKGRIVSLIDVEAGFHPDLTGQENIFLNGMIIGMSNTEIKNKFQQIVDFADIKNFITAPLYTYSSGMKLRLGFSIAIHSEADIFLLDEVLNLGDQNFRKKLDSVMGKMLKGGTTILMISQWEEYLKDNCYTMLTISEK